MKKFNTLAEFRTFLENSICGLLIADNSIYGVIRDYISSPMFSTPVAKEIVAQFESATKLHEAGILPSPYPLEEELLLIIKNLDTKYQAFIQMATIHRYSVLTSCLFLIEVSIRETCINWIKPVLINGFPMTTQINTLSAWEVDTFTAVDMVKQDLVLSNQQDVAKKFQTVLDRMQTRTQEIRQKKAVQDLVRTLKNMSELNPMDLKIYRQQLAEALENVDKFDPNSTPMPTNTPQSAAA